MKTVTIPTCANPFVVIVNGIKYTYPAGATVEVPDDVAAVIEQHDEAHNNPEPAPVVPPFTPAASEGGNSGGGLPALELSQETMMALFDTGTATLTETERSIFYKAMQDLSPVVIKGNLNGIKFAGVSNLHIDMDTYFNYFIADSGAMKLRVGVDDTTGYAIVLHQ